MQQRDRPTTPRCTSATSAFLSLARRIKHYTSGFEVAGIVLAAIPLFICAAELYDQERGAAFKFSHRQRILEKFCDELSDQRAFLFLCLQQTVGSTSLAPQEQLDLVHDPRSPLWQSAHVHQELERVLGIARDPFLRCLKSLEESLSKLLRKDVALNLGPKDMVSIV